MTYRDKILDDILIERMHQDQKWGRQRHHGHVWMTILGEEYGEACAAMLECDRAIQDNVFFKAVAHYREELVQVAATALAALECLGNIDDDDSFNSPTSGNGN